MLLISRDNPYVGPRQFLPSETLYGRDKEIHQLVNFVEVERIAVLHSPSGAGKTSLIQAENGVIKRLEDDGFFVRGVARVNIKPSEKTQQEQQPAKPINRYIFSVISSLEKAWVESNNEPEEAMLKEDEMKKLTLSDYLEQRKKPAEKKFEVFIFDQFEEILILDREDQDAKRDFFIQIQEVFSDRNRWVLFSLREEYLAALEPYQDALVNGFEMTFRLDFLNLEAAKQAFSEPARSKGVTFEDAALEKQIDNLRTGPFVEPVLLQVVAYRLWEELEEKQTTISIKDIGDINNVRLALEKYYDESISKVVKATNAEERKIRDWCGKKLIHDGIRGQALNPGITGAGDWVKGLEDAYIIRTDTRSGNTWYELSHDKLIEPILQSNKEWDEKNHTWPELRAKKWEDEKKPPDMLLRGKELQDEEERQRNHSLMITKIEKKFLEESLAERKKEQRKQVIRWGFLGVGALAIIAFVLFFNLYRKAEAANQGYLAQKQTAEAASALAVERFNLAEQQKATAHAASTQAVEQKKIALQQRATAEAAKQDADVRLEQSITSKIAAEALGYLSSQYDLALLLGVEAFHREDEYQTESSLLSAVQYEMRIEAFLYGHTRGVTAVAVSPDGTLFASAGGDKTVIVWSTATRQPMGLPLSAHKGIVNSIAFSPKGEPLLATGSSDHSIKIWNAITLKQERLAEMTHEGWVTAVAFSPDGKYLASAGTDMVIRLWDVKTGSPVGKPLAKHTKSIRCIAFSPDGRYLASSGDDKSIILWDVRDVKNVYASGQPLTGHSGLVRSLAFSPNGNLLASGSDDTTILLWDLKTRRLSGQPLLGNQGWVYSLDFSPDGKFLAAGYWDKTILVWNVDQGRLETQPLLGHSGTVTGVRFLPKGVDLVSGGEDSKLILWNWRSLQADYFLLLFKSGGEEPVVALSKGGNMMAMGGNDSTVRLWKPLELTVEESPIRVYNGSINSLEFSPDESLLALGTNDSSVIFWDTQTQTKVGGPVKIHDEAVTSLAFSPDGEVMASGSVDKTIVLWDVAARQPRPDRLKGHMGTVNALAFSSDGRLLASGSEDGTVILWDAKSGEEVSRLIRENGGAMRSVAFSPDGKLLASANNDTIYIWDVASRKVVGKPLKGHRGLIRSISFSEDGTKLASGSDDKDILIWDMETHEPIGKPLAGNHGWVYWVSFQEDNNTILAGYWDGSILRWQLRPDRLLRKSFSGLGGWTRNVIFSPDGKRLVVANDENYLIEIYNSSSLKLIEPRLSGHTDVISDLAFSPDGSILASASLDGKIIFWDSKTGKQLGKPLIRSDGLPKVFSIAFSPDGTLLAAGSDDCTVVFWDVATRTIVGKPHKEHTDWVNSVAFSADGHWLASASDDQAILLWDVATKESVGKPLIGHNSPIYTVAFDPDPTTNLLASGGTYDAIVWDLNTREPIVAPIGFTDSVDSVKFSLDGRFLAIGSYNQTFELWDVKSRQRLGQPFIARDGGVLSLAFSPDGKTIATGHNSSKINIWDIDPNNWAELACQIANRNLTPEEWEIFIGGKKPDYKTCPLNP